MANEQTLNRLQYLRNGLGVYDTYNTNVTGFALSLDIGSAHLLSSIFTSE